MKKLYINLNYVIADNNGIVSQYAMNRCVYTEREGNFKVLEDLDRGELIIAITDAGTWFDEAGLVAFDEDSMREFFRTNTGFNPASGGSGAWETPIIVDMDLDRFSDFNATPGIGTSPLQLLPDLFIPNSYYVWQIHVQTKLGDCKFTPAGTPLIVANGGVQVPTIPSPALHRLNPGIFEQPIVDNVETITILNNNESADLAGFENVTPMLPQKGISITIEGGGDPRFSAGLPSSFFTKFVVFYRIETFLA